MLDEKITPALRWQATRTVEITLVNVNSECIADPVSNDTVNLALQVNPKATWRHREVGNTAEHRSLAGQVGILNALEVAAAQEEWLPQ